MTLRAPRRIAALLAAPAFVAAGVAAAAPGADAAATTEPTYQGSALAVSAKVGIAGSTILDEVLPGLITYPPGATQSLLELPAELSQLVTLKVLNASSEVQDGKLVSNVSTANLGVLGDVIGAKVINADCLSDAGQNTGDSQIAGLTIAGTKVPVDPGPNVRIELPDALAAFVQGSIVIDEQVKTDDGGLQVTALHINLVVAPTALDDALNSVIASVREAAQSVKVVLEEVTGKTLDQLIGNVDKSTGDKTGDQKAAKTPKKGAQDADRAEVRASAAAPAAPQAATETEAGTEAAAPAAEAEQAAPVQKTDDAEVDAAEETAVAEEATEAEDTTATEDVTATEDATVTEDTDAAAAAERAERSEKGAKAAKPAEETSTDPAVAPAPAEAAPVAAPAPAAPADVKPTDSKSEAKGEKAGQKAGSDLAALDTVRKAVPSAADIAGAVGVDIVVSQVTCAGKPGKEVAKVNQLPGTGGNGDATRDVAIAGLGLLAAGGAAVYVTRRRGRGRHAAI
ncbi:choice-of-anchor P family protein [Sporichthya polymorpha]|uniref:choice-of-anchor P family protein n=1 Tax=Sporichthya polymorpha TaxID=35751 RepID=UPI0003A50574|nr:choice-of-anchor P family protein [Sporichthya polymorpha]